MKTIQLTLDDELFTRVNQALAQQKITLAAFISESLTHYLNRLRIKEMEKRHRDGYHKHPVQEGEFDVWENEQVWSA